MRSISFQVEDWSVAHLEMEWLYPLHWAEAGDYQDKIEIGLDIDAYDKLRDDGKLMCVTARNAAGMVVGYHWSIINPHIHHINSLTAFTDVYYLHPDYRKGMNGYNMIKFVENKWKELGVEKAYIASKSKLDKSKMFERMGWEKSETVYTKFLGDKNG